MAGAEHICTCTLVGIAQELVCLASQHAGLKDVGRCVDGLLEVLYQIVDWERAHAG